MQIMSKFSSVQCIIGLFVLAYPLSSCLSDFSFLLKASQSSKSALHFTYACTWRLDEFVATLVSLLCAVGLQTCRMADHINQQLFCSGYDASPQCYCLF